MFYIRIIFSQQVLFGSTRLFFIGLIISIRLSLIALFAQDSGFQKISQDEAIVIAIENNPELKNKILQLTSIQKDITWFPAFEKTELNYRYGQLYSPERGSYFEVIQNFGNPFGYGARKEFNSNKLDLIEKEREVLIEQKIQGIRNSYNQWIFTHHKLNLLEQQKNWYDDFMRIVELHFEQGEFDLLDKVKAETEYALVRNNYLKAQDEVLLSENVLKMHLFIEGDLVPESEELMLYEIAKDTVSGINSEIESMDQYVALNQTNIRMQKMKAFPDITAGYFHQKIGSARGFQGVMVGISLPLWFAPIKRNVEKAQLNEEIALNNYQQRVFEVEKEKKAIIIQMNRYFKQIQYYREHALRKSQILLQTSQVRFEKEDIEYFEHLENLNLWLQIQLEYIDLVKKYNEKAIELEYYVK